MNIIRLITLLFLLSISTTFAQVGEPSFFCDMSKFFGGIGYVCTVPLQWNSHDWLIAGGCVIFTGGAFLLDDELRELSLNNQNSFGDGLHSLGNTYGQSRYALAFAAGVYAVGFAADDAWLRGTGIVLLQTLISAGALNLALKTLVGRSRPYVGVGNTDFHPWSWKEQYFSFPSGHAVMAFGLSSVLAGRIKNTWATIGLYSLAGITAWSRMYSDNHWLSDVVVGGAMSTAIGLSLVRWYDGEREELNTFSLVPTPSGCTLQVRF
jgi:membrane-associated phospholipid phosphatase